MNMVPVSTLCKTVGLAQSTYYYNKVHNTEPKYNPEWVQRIDKLHKLDNTWGYRQVTLQLLAFYDIKINENTVRRYRKAKNIKAVRYFNAKPKVYPSHDPKFECTNSAKDLDITKPDTLWNIDITYHILKGGLKSYQFCIKDAFSTIIINSNYSTKFDMSLVLSTLEDAINLSDVSELTIHCDHGSQFISKDFLLLLKTYDIKQSMSRLGSPEDNQSIEAFFGWLKNTLKERKTRYTFEEMKLLLDDRIFKHNYVNITKTGKTRSTWGEDVFSILRIQ